MANILIVEDDVDIAQGIAELLESKSHVLDFAYNGRQALALLEKQNYELVLLDVNLPFVDGFDVSRSLLDNHLTKIPVIIMSARGDTEDILNGFECGAWDYLIKPFSFEELLARINANLAKSGILSNNSISTTEVTLDDNTLKFHYQNKSIQLHKIGFEIVKTLLNSSPEVVLTKELHQQLWGEDTPDSNPLRAHIYKLRKLFESHYHHEFIKTIKGIGYKFDVN